MNGEFKPAAPTTEIPVFLTFDDNFVLPACVAMYSLLKHADPRYFYKFYVAGGRIRAKGRRRIAKAVSPFSDRCEIEYLVIKSAIDEAWEDLARKNHFTVEVAYKLFIADSLRQYDKILISDVDVIFLDDVSPAYLEFDHNSCDIFAGVKPVGKIHGFYDESYSAHFSSGEIERQKTGIAGGLLVANLKKIREEGLEPFFLEAFKENAHRLVQSEQDVINITCYGRLKYLPLRYLVCAFVFDLYKDDSDDSAYGRDEIALAMRNPVQLHFPGKPKPWEAKTTMGHVWHEYMRESGMQSLYAAYSRRLRVKRIADALVALIGTYAIAIKRRMAILARARLGANQQ